MNTSFLLEKNCSIKLCQRKEKGFGWQPISLEVRFRKALTICKGLQREWPVPQRVTAGNGNRLGGRVGRGGAPLCAGRGVQRRAVASGDGQADLVLVRFFLLQFLFHFVLELFFERTHLHALGARGGIAALAVLLEGRAPVRVGLNGVLQSLWVKRVFIKDVRTYFNPTLDQQ